MRGRAALAELLEERLVEIEEAVIEKVFAVSIDPHDVSPEYARGVQAAVPAAVRYGIAALRSDGRALPPPPERLALQARLAAHEHVTLDIVFRRYLAGRLALDEFALDALHRDLPQFRGEAATVLAPLSRAFEHLISIASGEFRTELDARPNSSSGLLDRIRRLLADEPVGTHDLRYNFAGHHRAVVSEGPRSRELLQALSTAVGSQLLIVDARPNVVWAWFATRDATEHDALLRLTQRLWDDNHPLALGEDGAGLAGWRRSHEEAQVAFAEAVTGTSAPTFYSDVALRHAVRRDRLLSSLFRRLYVAPLQEQRDKGVVLRETLQAYFAANRNAQSAAAALGVTRQTVGARLRLVEQILGSPLPSYAAALELALLVHEKA